MESYNYWLSIVARELNEPEITVRSGLDVCVFLLSPYSHLVPNISTGRRSNRILVSPSHQNNQKTTPRGHIKMTLTTTKQRSHTTLVFEKCFVIQTDWRKDYFWPTTPRPQIHLNSHKRTHLPPISPRYLNPTRRCDNLFNTPHLHIPVQ